MIWAIGLWMVILVFGLYYIPIKETELKLSGEKIPAWFWLLAVVVGLSTIGFIPLVLDIFIEGLISMGYILYGSGVRAWITLIGTGVLYTMVYTIYTNRLKKLEESVEREAGM